MSTSFWASVEKLFGLMDLDGDGLVTHSDACQTMGICMKAIYGNALAAGGDDDDGGSGAGSKFDRNSTLVRTQVDRLFKEVDGDRDGRITLDEFKKSYQQLLLRHLEPEVLQIDVMRSIAALDKWRKVRDEYRGKFLQVISDAFAALFAPSASNAAPTSSSSSPESSASSGTTSATAGESSTSSSSSVSYSCDASACLDGLKLAMAEVHKNSKAMGLPSFPTIDKTVTRVSET